VQDFTGTMESVTRVKTERPQEWQVIMTESGVRTRKRS
jgi:hypothetical protein